jgi:hypothetical protein
VNELYKYGIDRVLRLTTALAACYVCCALFAPLYELVKLYDAACRGDEALATAKIILTKSVKIPSPAVAAIKHEMRQLIEAREHADDPDTESRTCEEPENNATRQGETPHGAALPP